jgi:hypothetical protein
MTEEKLIKATHQGDLTVGDLTLDCYVLEDGRRVLSRAGLAASLGKNRATNLTKFLSEKSFQPAIPNDLIASINSPILFTPPTGGRSAYGYKATILVDICDAVLLARKNGRLSKPDARLADQCEILTRAFARVGITALIDEATGYIKDKKKAEYIELFKQFVADAAKEWQKEFPDPFFDMVYKVYGKSRLAAKNQHPQYFGYFIKKYVYQPLAGSDGVILEMLEEKNPKVVNSAGNKVRKKKLFQFLEGVGTDALRQHIWRLIGIGEASETKAEFERKFAKVFPAKNQQLEFELDK